MNSTRAVFPLILVTATFGGLFGTTPALADNDRLREDRQRVIEHWTTARQAAAIPRDLRIDKRGLGYLKKPDGSLQPYGHSEPAGTRQIAAGKPSGDGDTTPPVISNMNPAAGATIGSSYTFSATITDPSGIKSVSMVITYLDGSSTQSFTPRFVGNDTWEIALEGFVNGNWAWQLIAKDNAGRGGNTQTTDKLNFTVDAATPPDGGNNGSGDGSYIVSKAHWQSGGTVQTAAGRIYFEMPANPKWRRWSGYVCSGTVVTDGVTGRSIIITAAHCVYDDANKAFARNVLFIPDQDGTSATATDLNCGNDPLGCWVPSFGVVDQQWTTYTFPDNIEWDYAYYVVEDSGAHKGTGVTSDALDAVAGSLPISFAAPEFDDGDPAADSLDFTHALGYSYSEDPNFMYCAEDMTTEGALNWWLPGCGLSGGASGGPWLQPMNTATGTGPLMSVNSWGYTTGPGMAGPMLDNSSASCLFSLATTTAFSAVPDTEGNAGVTFNGNCP